MMTTSGLEVMADPASEKAPPDLRAWETNSQSCRATISEGPLGGARIIGTLPRVASTEKSPWLIVRIVSVTEVSLTDEPLYAAYLGTGKVCDTQQGHERVISDISPGRLVFLAW